MAGGGGAGGAAGAEVAAAAADDVGALSRSNCSQFSSDLATMALFGSSSSAFRYAAAAGSSKRSPCSALPLRE